MRAATPEKLLVYVKSTMFDCNQQKAVGMMGIHHVCKNVWMFYVAKKHPHKWQTGTATDR